MEGLWSVEKGTAARGVGGSAMGVDVLQRRGGVSPRRSIGGLAGVPRVARGAEGEASAGQGAAGDDAKAAELEGQKAFLQDLAAMVPKWVNKVQIDNGEMIVTTSPESLWNLVYFLREHMNAKFASLADITAVDYPARAKRFEVVYQLLSHSYASRLRIKVQVDELTPLHSVTKIHSAAGWYERETWDMFGIFFLYHPDLRRILTDYGFEGHPLRKDFPLSGYVEVRYDDSEKRVVYEPLELTQEYRYFDFQNPWEKAVKQK